MNEANEEDRRQWHLSKSVPITAITALFIQTLGIVWWAATIENHVQQNNSAISVLKQEVLRQRDFNERVIRIETLLQGIGQALAEIKLDIRQKGGE